MNALEKLITNKRVAIVGPSGHLLQHKLGKKIDSYDVVCRLNELRPIGHEEHYGSRADILFWHLNNCDKNIFIKHSKSDVDTFNAVKLLVYPRQHNDVNRRGCGKSTPQKNAQTWFPNTPFFQYDSKKIADIEKGRHLTLGVLSIIILLNYQLKELFIAGFSFYSSNYLRHYTGRITSGHGHNNKYGIKAVQLAIQKTNIPITSDPVFEKIIYGK